jgi:hypothetical protein
MGKESAVMGVSAGEIGPSLAKLAEATAGGNAVEFQAGAPPKVSPAVVPPLPASNPAVKTAARSVERKVEWSKSRAHFFFSTEYYAVENAKDNAVDNTAAAQTYYSGYVLNGSVNSAGAYGGRIGLLYDVNDNFSAGISGGYIYGPSITQSASGAICVGSVCGMESESGHIHADAWRILAEFRPTFPIDQDWKAILGWGAGIAIMHINEDALSNGPSYQSSSGSANFSGFTYEVSPMLSYKSLGVGARYAVFPSFSGSSEVLPFKWQTWGVFVESRL